jgi:chorismate mutase
MTNKRNRTIAVGILAGTLVMQTAAPARADTTSPLAALADAIAQRLQIAESVAAFKWSMQAAVEDPNREQQELAGLREDAAAQQLDPDYVVRVFGDQFNAMDAIEYSRFADWKLNPADVPAAPADLSASRAAIDGLNNKILSQIVLNGSLLGSPGCARQLKDASTETIRVHRFGDLYQQALSRATGSFCQAPPPA